MIVKKIKAKKNKSSFKNLSDYILDSKNDNAKVLIDYMLDVNNEMEKVEGYFFSNCSFEDSQSNIKEIINTQKLNTTSKQDKTLHLVVSFQEDECPNIDTLKQIEVYLMKSIGMQHHQRLSVVHTNTNNLHMHIAVNKVDPITLKVVNPYNDVYKLQQAAMEIEKKFNLKADNHLINIEKISNKYYIHSDTISFEDWAKSKIAKEAKAILENKDSTFADIVKLLSQHDLEFRERRKGFCISSKNEKLFCKASSVYKGLSKQALLKRFGSLDISNTTIQDKQEKAKYRYDRPPANNDKNNLWQEYSQLEAAKKTQKVKELFELKAKRSLLGRLSPAEKSHYKAFFAQERAKIYQKFKSISYRDFLVNAALNGNEEAVMTLRKSTPAPSKDENNLYSSLGKDNPKIFQNVSYISKEGYAVYKDGSNKVVDKGNFIKASMHAGSKEILLDMLLMSIDRFGNKLDITGDNNFKKEVLNIASEYNIDVEFADKNMQAIHEINRCKKIEQESKKAILSIVSASIDRLNSKANATDASKNGELKILKRIQKKASLNKASFFAGDLKNLGFALKEIDTMQTNIVNVSIDGFVVNDKNLAGIWAMNDEIKKALTGKQDKADELARFLKFTHLLENTDKIKDIALGFYENKKINTKYYAAKFDMEIEKIDKTASVIDLSSELNLAKLKEMASVLEKSKANKVSGIDKGMA